MSFLLALCLALPVPAFSAAPPVDDLADAEKSFRDGLRSSDLAARKRGLSALVGVGDPKATPILVGEFARAFTALRQARDQARQLESSLDARQHVLKELELRARKDESLEQVIRQRTRELKGVEEDLDRERERVGEEEPWVEALVDGARTLYTALPRAKQRTMEKSLWDEAEKSPQLAMQLAAVEFLGRVGGDGTAVRLQKLLAELSKQRKSLRRKLPKMEADVRKLEKRIQEEAEKNGGRSASMAQYGRVREEAAQTRRTLTLTGYLCEACVGAAGQAVAREQGDVQRRSLQALGRALAKSKDGERLMTLDILAQVRAEPVQAALRELLATEREPAAIARMLDDLAALGDESIVPQLLATYIDHPSWHVRARAAAALAMLRSKDAIPVLIERIGTAEGRLAGDIRAALASLTGEDFRTNHELWKRWWDEKGRGFVVPAAADVAKAAEAEHDTVGVTFFGIHTTSQKVLFVIDLSGSMNWSTVARYNPYDDPNSPPDLPKGGEISRLEAAKRATLQALGGLQDGAHFNFVLYASDVWSWNDGVQEMEPAVRTQAQDYVRALTAVGGTNIYGALQQAFDLCGVTEGADEWREPVYDTVFLLTDGRPSVGVTIDPEEIIAYAKDRNSAAGIVLHTIGISGAQDAHLLRTLAEQNGGTYASR